MGTNPVPLIAPDPTDVVVFARSCEFVVHEATTLLRLLRQIVDRVDQAEPQRLDTVLHSMASAVDRLSPDLLLELTQQCDDHRLIAAVLSRLSDDTIARFVVRHVAEQSVPFDRLALAVQAMAPDRDRQQRLLLQAHEDVTGAASRATDELGAAWDDFQQHLAALADAESSAATPAALAIADVRARALEVEEASDDPPERITAWLETVSTTALGTLDVTLVLDMLRMDHDPARWGSLMTPVVRLLDDLLLVGDFEAAQRLVMVLVNEAADERSERRAHAIDAIDILIDSSTVRHITAHLATITEDQFEVAKAMCLSLGEVIVRPLVEALSTEERPAARGRLTSILIAFGPVGRRTIDRLKSSPHLAIRRTALHLLSVADEGAA